MLLTKLHRPQVTREHVYRDHLIDLLNKNMYKPFTLVSAGAGYGKSMLISSWLEKSKIPYAWVSLSDEDNEIRGFMECISTSVQKVFPKALIHLNNYVQAAELPPMSKIAESLINGLDEIAKEFVLVLDDYHLIQNEQINELINQLLQFPPQLMHLVIICRSDPFLNLSSLRAHSRISEIRAAELCFNESEILELLKNIFQTESSLEISHKLMQQTEGWITGLRLLLLMIKKGEDLNESLEKIHAINPTTTHFLLEEVISNQPEPIRNCIIKMSILDRFGDELIDQVCFPNAKNLEADSSGKEVIQTLLDANLFTISLDYKGKWFRFHHLFQEMLQNQLKKQHSIDEINAYHLKASEWFDKNDFKEKAVKAAIEGQKIELAADLVSRYRFELLETGQINRLNQLIEMLPESTIGVTPALLTAKAYVLEARGQFPELIASKEKAKAIISSWSEESLETKVILGEIQAIESLLFMISGDTKSASESSKKALELLPDIASHACSWSVGVQMVSYQMVNDIKSALSTATEFPSTSSLPKIRLQLFYSIVYALEGNPTLTKKTAFSLLNIAEKHKHLESVLLGKYFLSAAHYLSNEDEQAVPYLESVVKDPYVSRPLYLVQCAFLLSVLYIDKGEAEKASELMDFIIRYFEEINELPTIAIAKAMQVELALKRNDIDKAQLLNKQLDSYELMPPLWFFYVPQLTPVKLKLVISTLRR
jgi:LuxR family maltose regulon positive regulatory protein